ncbi:Short-chain dehydrogenase/reductase SDR [Macrophomina phaseolina MS6]|uniref:Short-chain dehydrogenase/reductase SDR n=1 Tax=Macrophomina phaseolina (strain MS6) TaxID=1126212 RepID=K2R7Z2_MACPH|nr:Short-chain dehydrogenase/reductase SDR [Macrophomina phaseolina MS6]
MTTYELEDAEFEALKGKTIIVTGGASGIGRAAVKIAHKYGANVAIADCNEAEGEALKAELDDPDNILFHKTDVSDWDNVLSLFNATIAKFGNLHAVLSNAGINTEDFAATIDKTDPSTGKLLPPGLKTMDVNLTGQIYMAKAALHYFGKFKDDGVKRQISMTGSAASFIDCPPLHLYCASKMGVLGFLRGIRTQVEARNVTINMVAPWMTGTPRDDETGTDMVPAETPMLLEEFYNVWGELPRNQPAGPARALLLPVVRPEVNGKSFYVAGNQIVEVEDRLHEAQPIWLGEQLSKHVDEGQRRLIPLAPPM